jgi:hypothetical protein
MAYCASLFGLINLMTFTIADIAEFRPNSIFSHMGKTKMFLILKAISHNNRQAVARGNVGCAHLLLN